LSVKWREKLTRMRKGLLLIFWIEMWLCYVEYRDEGLTPKIPKDCPQVLQEIMEMCWKKDPNQRPVSFILIILKVMYCFNFCYVFLHLFMTLLKNFETIRTLLSYYNKDIPISVWIKNEWQYIEIYIFFVFSCLQFFNQSLVF
jgi:hypothetical protein